MEFMLLFLESKDAPKVGPEGFAAMKQFATELASQGKLRRGAPLASEPAPVRVRVRDGKPFVSDGPFAETKEVLGGFCIIDAANRAEAIEIARRCPHARYGIVEAHNVQLRYAFTDSGNGKPFLLTFHREPGLTDSDGAKLRTMIAFGEGLARDGKLVETAPLKQDPPPARIEVRGGKALVIDGPFAETKEGVGGYSIVRVASREEAIDLAKRYPHATWGPVEVREILFFDPT